VKSRALLAALIVPCVIFSAQAQTTSNIGIIDSAPVEEVPDTSELPSMQERVPAPIPPASAEKKAPSVEHDTAVLQGLKKVTAEVQTFDAPIDTPVAFGGLSILVKKCMGAAEGERPENTALIRVQDTKLANTPVTMFSGWMFSSSPAISALEHPVYDITLIECTDRKKPAAEPEKEAAKPAPGKKK